MQLPHYDFQVSTDSLNFQFESVSASRTIHKFIEYSQIDEKSQLYNLALIDKDEHGRFSDLAVSNNDDMAKVLATVAQTMSLFFRIRPDANVIFKGSTPARTRLYRMAISKYWAEIEKEFTILGLINGVFVPFEPNHAYEAFVVRVNQQPV